MPVPRDVDAARDPNLVVRLHVVDELRQPHGPAGPPDEAAVQPHRHHLRAAAAAFLVKAVEAVLEILEEVLAGVEALRRCKAHVVGVERVGDDEVLRTVGLLQEVGQVVGIIVGGIEPGI